mmetsp:Transcript_29595/g.95426  ORF Transcript_29595/g.95426 Transcript_29595/m.95426 type:complete len:217 (+) Transcript_29595:337-987(+)
MTAAAARDWRRSSVEEFSTRRRPTSPRRSPGGARRRDHGGRRRRARRSALRGACRRGRCELDDDGGSKGRRWRCGADVRRSSSRRRRRSTGSTGRRGWQAKTAPKRGPLFTSEQTTWLADRAMDPSNKVIIRKFRQKFAHDAPPRRENREEAHGPAGAVQEEEARFGSGSGDGGGSIGGVVGLFWRWRRWVGRGPCDGGLVVFRDRERWRFDFGAT